jgi:putative transposase
MGESPGVGAPSPRFSVCTAKYSPGGFPPTALSQSVASELLEAFRAGEGVDLIRDSVRLVMQDLIEVDAAEQIGAARYERSDAPRPSATGLGRS